MIPPTIENATHAGPMPDGRWALVMGYQALILKEGRPAAADGITARIATDLVKWEATEPHRRAKLLDLRAWLRGLKTPACERCDGGGSVTCSEDHEHECHRCKGTGEGFLTVDVAGAPMSARIRAALVRGRLLACDLLAAVPREAQEVKISELLSRLDAEAVRQLDESEAKLETSHANERRLVDQLQRLEASLGAERLEATALKQQMEDLRSRLQDSEADWRRLAVAGRALCNTLEDGKLSCAENVAVGNLRRALGSTP